MSGLDWLWKTRGSISVRSAQQGQEFLRRFMAKALAAGLDTGSDSPDRIWFYGPGHPLSVIFPFSRISYAEAWLERDSMSESPRISFLLDYQHHIKLVLFGSLFLALFPLLFSWGFEHLLPLFAVVCLIVFVIGFGTRLFAQMYFEWLANKCSDSDKDS